MHCWDFWSCSNCCSSVIPEIISTNSQDMHRVPANYVSRLRGAFFFPQDTTQLILKLFFPPQMKKRLLDFIIKWKPSNSFSHISNNKYYPQGQHRSWNSLVKRFQGEVAAMARVLQYSASRALMWKRNWPLLFTNSKDMFSCKVVFVDTSHISFISR